MAANKASSDSESGSSEAAFVPLDVIVASPCRLWYPCPRYPLVLRTRLISIDIQSQESSFKLSLVKVIFSRCLLLFFSRNRRLFK